MFTGIINNIGVVTSVSDNLLSINTENKLFKNIDTGTSISVDGVCLTLKSIEDDNINFQISNESEFTIAIIQETYKRTNFQYLEPGTQVNIEYDILSKYVERLINDN